MQKGQKGQINVPKGIAFFLGRLLNTQFYTPKLQQAFKQKHDILSYMFKKNIIQIIELQTNPLKKYLSRPELEVEENNEDKLKNLKIKKKNLQGNLEKLKYYESKNKCLFLNQISFQLSHSRYVSMAYGVLVSSIINLTLFRRQHGVRKGFLMILIAHIMGQTGVFKRQNMVYDFIYPIYQKYQKPDIDLMIKQKV